VVVQNWNGPDTEMLSGENNPENPDVGHRNIPFSKEIFIEREDFMEEPPKKYFRLSPGQMVRLKHAYIVKCTGFKKDDAGNVTEVHVEYIKESRSGSDTSGLQVKGVIHWVSAAHALNAEVRLYDRLFRVEDPSTIEGDFREHLNPDSLRIQKVMAEPSLAGAQPGEKFQFLRMGYFTPDPDSTPGSPVFNRTVTLRDAWAKEQKKQ